MSKKQNSQGSLFENGRHLRIENTGVKAATDWRNVLRPADTLGAADSSEKLAMDAQLDADGVYSLFQHGIDLGQMPQATGFMGYGALQSIAQNGLVRACVETVADDMTRAWIELHISAKEDGDVDKEGQLQDAQRSDRINEELTRLNIQRAFHDAAVCTGYYGGCLLFIDTGYNDWETLQYPLNLDPDVSIEARLGFFKGLKVIDPFNVSPFDYDSSNPISAHYFEPRFWLVNGRRVHASRFIRIIQNEVPTLFKPAYNFFGIPQAQLLWDYVMHYQQNRDSANRLLNKFSLTVFKTDMTDVLTGAPDGFTQMQNRIQLMLNEQNNDGMQLIDKDREDIAKVETPLGGVTDIVRQSFEAIAAMNRTPAVKLLGISPSGFNATGDSDIRNYYDHVKSQQEKMFRVALNKVIELIQKSIFGEADNRVSFTFKQLSEDEASTTAMTQQAIATTICSLVQSGIISPEEGRKRLAAEPKSGFNDLDPDELPNASDDELADMGLGGGPQPQEEGAQQPQISQEQAQPEQEAAQVQNPQIQANNGAFQQ